MKLTRMSWPIQEYDALRVMAQKMANAMHNIKVTREKTETSPIAGNPTFCFFHLLVGNKEEKSIEVEVLIIS